MTKMTRRLSYLPFQSKKWHQEEITGTRTEIENRAKQISWIQSCGVEVCETDEKGFGFGDTTFGKWGFIECKSEMQYLKSMA